jgi:thiosulfate reductase / polysulfide reductase chain A
LISRYFIWSKLRLRINSSLWRETAQSSSGNMENGTLNRRSFLHICGLGSLGATIGGCLPMASSEFLAGSGNGLGDGDIDRVVPTTCEMCFWKCGVDAHVRGEEVVALTGNPHHPLSRGRLCPRGVGGLGLLYDPDRLNQPLIRVGERGSQEFRTATWEEALDRVAEGLKRVAEQHGPEALALFYHGAGGSFFKTLMKGYGSANIAAPSYAQCRGPREVGFELTFGEGVGSPEILDIPDTRLLVLIGSHLGENMHNTQVQDFAAGLSRGMRLITVDPRYSVAAGKSDHWLPVKPGTDIALILGWANLIIQEEWYDKHYIAQNAVGFEKFAEEVRRYTPEAVYLETGIKPQQLIDTAREIAKAAPYAIIHPGRRVTWYGDDSQRSRAIALLNALLGNWAHRGGFYLPSKAELKPHPQQPKVTGLKPVADRIEGQYPFAGENLASGLRQATLTSEPSEIKAWMVYGTNLPKVLPNPQQTIEAIQKLDFLAVIDVLPVEITGWADVVLPECTYLERHDDLIAPWYREPYIGLRQPVVEPIGESRPGWWMAKELAKRLGLESHFPWKDPIELHDARLNASGYSAVQRQQLRDQGALRTNPGPLFQPTDVPYEFGTPSGKIEFWSQQLADTGFDPIPVYRRPEQPAHGTFRLLTGRAPVHTFSRTTNNARLLDQYPENEVWIQRAVAVDLGLQSGDRVMLRNQDGAETGPVKVKATERIRHDCVYMVHGFGHRSPKLRRAHGNGGDDNAVTTRYITDPLMGATGMSVNFVTLEKVGSGEAAAVEA